MNFVVLLLLGVHPSSSAYTRTYTVAVASKGATPVLSVGLPPPHGHSPCNYTFNPAWLAPGPGLNHSVLLLRAAQCPPEYGGAEDHILYAVCSDDGSCGDVERLDFTGGPFPLGSQDPRSFYYDGFWWVYTWAPGPGQQTVYLVKSATPLDPASWVRVASELPWHRNGCVIIR